MTVVGAVEAAVAAVVDSDNRIRGTAFWVTPTLAISCAHVIDKCVEGLVRLAPAAQSGTLDVLKVDSDDELDLALLTTESIGAPMSILALSTVCREGRTIASHGYPANKPRSRFSKGHALTPPGTVAGTNEITFKTTRNKAITISGTSPDGGQSGGPAYDTTSKRVIGVLRLTGDPDTGDLTTYAIPSSSIIKRWPQLPHHDDVDGGPVSPRAPIPPVGLRLRRDPVREGSDVRLVERDNELAAIGESLSQRPVATIVAEPTKATVHGQPGIGKSALALEYAYQHLTEYSAVWWIDASNELTTAESFRQFAEAVRIPTDGVEDPVIRDRVVDHLQQRQQWLAIFDNAEDKNSVDRWLPPLGNGVILITSRSPANWARPIWIGRLSNEAIAQWLLDATTPADQAPAIDQVQAANHLAEQIDGLALAAAQAVAFIAYTGASLADYTALYLAEHDQMLAAGKMPEDHPDSVATTISVATANLSEAGHGHAVRLLDIIAYFAPDRIPRDLFTAEALGGKRQADIELAIGHLRNYGLIETNDAGDLNVHRLTQAVVRANHGSNT